MDRSYDGRRFFRPSAFSHAAATAFIRRGPSRAPFWGHDNEQRTIRVTEASNDRFATGLSLHRVENAERPRENFACNVFTFDDQCNGYAWAKTIEKHTNMVQKRWNTRTPTSVSISRLSPRVYRRNTFTPWSGALFCNRQTSWDGPVVTFDPRQRTGFCKWWHRH